MDAAVVASGVTLTFSTRVRGYLNGPPVTGVSSAGNVIVRIVQKRGSTTTTLGFVNWVPDITVNSAGADPQGFSTEYSNPLNVSLDSGFYEDGDEFYVEVDTNGLPSYLYSVQAIVAT